MTRNRTIFTVLAIRTPDFSGVYYEDGSYGARREPVGWHYVVIRASDGLQLGGSRIYETREKAEAAMAKHRRRTRAIERKAKAA